MRSDRKCGELPFYSNGLTCAAPMVWLTEDENEVDLLRMEDVGAALCFLPAVPRLLLHLPHTIHIRQVQLEVSQPRQFVLVTLKANR